MSEPTNENRAPNAMAIATPADYVRDPTRWGSPEIAALFPGFQHLDMRTSGAIIRLRHGGSGPPLLLLHGNPSWSFLYRKIIAGLPRCHAQPRDRLNRALRDEAWGRVRVGRP